MLWVKVGGSYIDYRPIGEEPRTLTYAAAAWEDCLIEGNSLKVMLQSFVEVPYAVEGFSRTMTARSPRTTFRAASAYIDRPLTARFCERPTCSRCHRSSSSRSKSITIIARGLAAVAQRGD
jgi:hypothetical protein